MSGSLNAMWQVTWPGWITLLALIILSLPTHSFNAGICDGDVRRPHCHDGSYEQQWCRLALSIMISVTPRGSWLCLSITFPRLKCSQMPFHIPSALSHNSPTKLGWLFHPDHQLLIPLPLYSMNIILVWASYEKYVFGLLRSSTVWFDGPAQSIGVGQCKIDYDRSPARALIWSLISFYWPAHSTRTAPNTRHLSTWWENWS